MRVVNIIDKFIFFVEISTILLEDSIILIL